MNVGIREIFQKDERTIGITWTDNHTQAIDVVKLRQNCPCAMCVDEKSGKRKADLRPIDNTVRPISIQSVGNYALNIHFSDGHTTGIYTFGKLRTQE